MIKNFCNPVPIHTSKSLWYDNRETFKDTHSHTYVPLGRILPFQITGGSELLSSTTQTLTVSDITNSSYIMANGSYTATFPYADDSEITFTKGNYRIILTKTESGKYSGFLGKYSSSSASRDQYDWKLNLMVGGVYLFAKEKLYDFSSFVLRSDTAVVSSTLSGNVFGMSVNSSHTIKLFDANTNATIRSGNFAYFGGSYADIVPAEIRTASRYATVTFSGVTFTGTDIVDGSYYMEITIGNTTYYSEPFQWRSDVSNLIRIRYRSSVPLITSQDYITFSSNGVYVTYELYMDAKIMMSPFYYDEDITESDGVKMVNKRVSYKDHTFTYYKCTEYFADALRHVWHCDQIEISADGKTYDVDYMDAPQPDWGNDNHFCTVPIEFQTDTIVQSNGVATTESNLASARVFSESFSESFN